MTYKPQHESVGLHVEVSLTGQKIQSEESVIAPALPHLKVWRKLSNDVFGGVAGGLMDHLHPVFIPGRNTVSEKHFRCIATISQEQEVQFLTAA